MFKWFFFLSETNFHYLLYYNTSEGRRLIQELTLVDLLIVMVRSSALPLRLLSAIPSSSARFLSSSTSYVQLNKDNKLMKKLQRRVSNIFFYTFRFWTAFLLPASTCPYLIPLHQRFILPAESFDLLVQLQVSLIIPFRHHVTRALRRNTADRFFKKIA